MNKQQYLDALKAALAGLPAEQTARTLAYYEQRFVDGAAAGQSEEEVAAGLEEPRKIALTLRTNSHLSDLQKKTERPLNPLRVMVAAIGLGIFNLFMLVPGLVAVSLVVTLYLTSLGFYGTGIVMGAAGMAGVVAADIPTPVRHVVKDVDGERVRTTVTHFSVTASHQGIEVEPVTLDEEVGDERLRAGSDSADIGPVRVTTGLDHEERSVITAIGLALLAGGVLLSMLSVVITRYSLIGLKRYLEMNFNILRGR